MSSSHHLHTPHPLFNLRCPRESTLRHKPPLSSVGSAADLAVCSLPQLEPLLSGTERPARDSPTERSQALGFAQCSQVNGKPCPSIWRTGSAWSLSMEIQLQDGLHHLPRSPSGCFICSHPVHQGTHARSFWLAVSLDVLIFSAINWITALSLVLGEQGINIICLRWRLYLNHLIVPLICQITLKAQGIKYYLNKEFLSTAGSHPPFYWNVSTSGPEHFRGGSARRGVGGIPQEGGGPLSPLVGVRKRRAVAMAELANNKWQSVHDFLLGFQFIFNLKNDKVFNHSIFNFCFEDTYSQSF